MKAGAAIFKKVSLSGRRPHEDGSQVKLFSHSATCRAATALRLIKLRLARVTTVSFTALILKQ